jgi:hypothetical protein
LRGEIDTAARLLGAATALQERIGEAIQGYSVDAYEEAAAPVVERLGKPEVAAAFAAGQAMSEADATGLALAAVGRAS